MNENFYFSITVKNGNLSKKNKTNKLKIFNDPVYGFIRIPNSLIFDIIEHPYFQRLRRISQMGFSNLVYPGANHTRFHHALGCLELMQKAVRVLRVKGIDISLKEENGLYIAILLHDIGHGPFSHALEHSIVNGITHEEISLQYMHELNAEFNGELDVAIQIFTKKYPKKFLHQLISSQLDIDRLDYLKRDSFYTGVVEGNISSDRLLAMMSVENDELVIEEKGMYSIEKFLIARRLMYWQVYLHKTGLVAEHILVNVLQRAKDLVLKGEEVQASKALKYFLTSNINESNFDLQDLEIFALLDDYDILSAIKEWVNHPDFVLSSLSKMIINRKLLRIEIQSSEIEQERIDKKKKKISKKLNLTEEEIPYFVFNDNVKNLGYNVLDPIKIINKKGEVIEISQASDQLNISSLSKMATKYFLCYPKNNTIV